MKTVFLAGGSMSALAAMALAAPAMAQVAGGGTQDAAPTQVAEPASDALADIVVTAERRTQSLQQVPIAATVLTGAQLAERGVVNVADLQQVAPSVAINTYNRSTFINIRGVGIAQSQPTSSPGVAYYIDGQLVPHEQLIGLSFYDIGSVEVLRGPQGTLTGQNSTGGAVFVRSPAPIFGRYSASGEFTVGNYGRYQGIAAANLGFSDSVALRVAYIHDQRDSFSRNIGRADIQPGNANLDAGRITLALRSADDALQVNVRGEYFDSNSDNNAVKRRGDTVSSDPFVIEEDANSYLKVAGYRIGTDARYKLTPGIDVRGSISWQNASIRDQVDGDRTASAFPVPAGRPATGANTALFPGRIGQNYNAFRTLVSEVTLLSSGKGPFTWVAGGFLLDEQVPVQLLRDNFNTREFVASNSTISTQAHNNSKSLFGQANWYAMEKLELLAGARYSWDRQDYARFAAPGVTAPFTTTALSEQLTGKLGINYHLDSRNLIYLTASRGYKAGGVNLLAAQGNYAPERNTVYELGAKTELFDRHLRINGDVFYSNYKGIQFNSLFAGLPVTQNAASGRSYGAELEATLQVAGFQANIGGSYLHSEFASATCLNNQDSTAVDAACPAGNQVVPDGRTLPFSPRLTVNGGLQYALPLGGDRHLTPRVQWSHLSTQYATPFQSATTIVPTRDVFDARLKFDIDSRYSIEGFVNNFTNRTYIASQVQNATSALGGIIYGAPRQYGMRLAIKFE